MPRTYQKLFKQKVVITNINRRSLGFRLFADDVVTFFLSGTVFLLLDTFTPFRLLNFVANRWLVILGCAFGFTWLARKLDPDGKPLVKYLLDAARYPFRSHVSDGWTRKARTLVWKQGKLTTFRRQARAWWTRGDLHLPVEVRVRSSIPFTFQSSIHLDVKLGRRTTRLRRTGRLGWPHFRQINGLRPGVYEISGRTLRRLDS